jgi:transcriptional regulator with XRE-family HTH domain
MARKQRRNKGKKKKLLNLVGPQIRQLRYQMGLTQEKLAVRCQLKGFDISRGTLSQIEAQLRCVTDSELLSFSQVLRVSTDSLFPSGRAKTKR